LRKYRDAATESELDAARRVELRFGGGVAVLAQQLADVGGYIRGIEAVRGEALDLAVDLDLAACRQVVEALAEHVLLDSQVLGEQWAYLLREALAQGGAALTLIPVPLGEADALLVFGEADDALAELRVAVEDAFELPQARRGALKPVFEFVGSEILHPPQGPVDERHVPAGELEQLVGLAGLKRTLVFGEGAKQLGAREAAKLRATWGSGLSRCARSAGRDDQKQRDANVWPAWHQSTSATAGAE
ncbi:MAG: hypothetical protein HRF50_14700, partial [Phycisphaerae bacterium]